MNILIILTSNENMGEDGGKTGFWLEELAAPYYVFKEGGSRVTLASPMGGRPPMDPRSNELSAQSPDTRRFLSDPEAMAALNDTHTLSSLRAEDFDGLFYPGGHGPMWDLAEDPASITLIEESLGLGHPVGAVCHGPAVFRHVKDLNGQPVVQGKSVTGFSNSEEEASGLTHIVPFLVEDMLRENGGVYSQGEDWESHVVADGLLVTGQNPASSRDVAVRLLKALGESQKRRGAHA